MPILIGNALVVKNVAQALRRPVLWNPVDFCQDIDAFGDHALENDRPRASFIHLVEELLRVGVKDFVISQEVSDEDIGIRQTSSWFSHAPPLPMLDLSSPVWKLPVAHFRRIR